MKLREFYESLYLPEYIQAENRPGYARNNIGCIEKYILPLFGDREMDSFRKLDWVKFQNHLRNEHNLSEKTTKNHQSSLRMMFRTAAEWEIIDHYPGIKSIKVPEPDIVCLRPDEVNALKVAALSSPVHYRALLIMALATGMRIGELRGLQWADIETRNGITGVNVQRSISGRENKVGDTKNGRSRFIPLNERGLYATEIIGDFHKSSPYLFFRPDFPLAFLTYKACDCALKTMLTKARLPSYGWHAIRHTVATALIGKNIPAVKVRDLLGHVDIRTTMRYVHLDPSTLSEAVRAIENF